MQYLPIALAIGKARNYDIVRVSKANFNNNAVGVQRLYWKSIRTRRWFPHSVIYNPSYQIAFFDVVHILSRLAYHWIPQQRLVKFIEPTNNMAICKIV